LNPFGRDTLPKNSTVQPWTRASETREKRVPKAEQKYGDKCAILDTCGYYSANSPDAGTLALKLPQVEKGGLILCCARNQCAQKELIRENIKVMLGDEEIDPDGWEMNVPHTKCIRLMKKFPSSVSEHTYVGITIRETATVVVHISQIIVY
jgi:hypothetical protein